MFTPASKEAAKLRAALFGPSGAGKTFTALRLANGIGGRIAVIDSERGSASKYADRFTFDCANLAANQCRIADYVRVIRGAAQAGYDVLIVDSLTHAWQQLLSEIDALAKAKYRGNTWSAWSEGTPLQRQLVDAILDYPGHVIVTMRSKTEWTTEKDRNGKDKPIRVGLSPEQGKGIEYEFDFLLELSTEHILTVIKDRSGRFQDLILPNPGEDLGREMAEWLSDGAQPAAAAPATAPPATEPPPPTLVAQAQAGADRSGFTPEGLESWLDEISKGEASSLAQLPATWLEKMSTSAISADVVARHNANTVSTEPPATWQQPAAQPEPQPA
jgi:hypothetical protein